MLLTIVVNLVILVLMLAACIGGFYAFLTHLPSIQVNVGLKPVAPEAPVELPKATIPANILEYLDLESEPHARDTRKQHARSLFADSQDWDYVFRMLQKEDQ